MSANEPQRTVMLRHTLATLAYRAAKVLRGAPADFSSFTPTPGGRSAGQILAHLGDLMEWAASIVEGKQTWHDSSPQRWDADVQRFFAAVARFDALLAGPPEAAPGLREGTEEKLFQGPIADALTHVGQLAIMRRAVGAPIRGENYFVADIKTGRVTADQTPPKREF
jgi:hypothetical protein